MSAVQISTFAFFFSTFFLSCSSTMDQHQLELQQNYEHVAYIADFPCHHPQPKVISVDELFSKDQCHGKAYYPDVTVLHRCECTGSCPSGQVCSYKTYAPVELPFQATYLQDIGGNKMGSWKMEYHHLKNHTECACTSPAYPHDNHNNLNNPYLASPPSSHDNHNIRQTPYDASPPSLQDNHNIRQTPYHASPRSPQDNHNNLEQHDNPTWPY